MNQQNPKNPNIHWENAINISKMPTKTKQKIKDAPDVYANNDASSDAYV